MNPDFIQVKEFEGELKISHKLKDLGVTVTTKELVVQKPHLTYRCNLSDMISILPYEQSSIKQMDFVHEKGGRQEIAQMRPMAGAYKIDVQAIRVQNRSGIFNLGRTELVLPIQKSLIDAIVKYGQLDSVYS